MFKYLLKIIGYSILEIILLMIYYKFSTIFDNKYPSNLFSIMSIFILHMSVCIIPFIISDALKKIKIVSKNKKIIHKYSEEFEKFYNELYKEYISDLERKRKKILIVQIVTLLFEISFLIIILIASLHIAISKLGIFNLWLLVTIAILGIIFNLWIKRSCLGREYFSDYKENVIKKIVTTLNSDFNYIAEGSKDLTLIKSIYEKTGVLGKKIEHFMVDDYIKGHIQNGEYIRIVDLEAASEDNDGKNVEIFYGIFAFFICEKNFYNPVIIANKKTNNKYLVELDNEEFNKIFNVYSKDKNLAVRILTHEVMESLIEFSKKNGVTYEIILNENAISFKFFTGQMFEPNLSENSLNKETLFFYYSILKFIIDISNGINKELQNFES